MEKLVFQFHITGKCNLYCRHCYRDGGSVQPLSFDDIIRITEQYRHLLIKCHDLCGYQKKGHINFTGGEPFIRDDVGDLINYCGENRENFTFSFLTNGSFLTDELIGRLKENGVLFIQLSIDGDESVHDSLRAPGDYSRTFAMAKKLAAAGIRTDISFTANAQNFKCLPAVVKECANNDVTRLWSDRIVPIGRGGTQPELEITKEILPEYIAYLKKAKRVSRQRKCRGRTELYICRSMQFLADKSCTYTCGAGKYVIVVDEYGNIMPCRRLPVICGNALTDDLGDVFFDDPFFRRLRLPLIPYECRDCKYTYSCRGGAKCQAYAKYGELGHADPACFMAGLGQEQQ